MRRTKARWQVFNPPSPKPAETNSLDPPKTRKYVWCGKLWFWLSLRFCYCANVYEFYFVLWLSKSGGKIVPMRNRELILLRSLFCSPSLIRRGLFKAQPPKKLEIGNGSGAVFRFSIKSFGQSILIFFFKKMLYFYRKRQLMVLLMWSVVDLRVNSVT